MGMRPSAGRTLLVPNSVPLATDTKTVQGLTPKRWLGKRDETADTFVQACARFVGWCRIAERYFAPREAAEGRVDTSMFIPPSPHLARPLSYCVARERVGSVYAGDGDAIRQVQMLLT